jgi:Fic family protein
VCELLKEAHVNQEDDLEYLVGVGLTEWATALFQPCVDVGIIKIEDMAGYRKGPIYIRGSKHVPPASEHIMDCMSVLKELISGEENPIVRAVLAHWFIGYIHPYFDGNGRSARFLMNFLLIQGGYPWAVVKNSDRSEYKQALESASVNNDIQPFAKFIKECFITV